MVRRQHCQAVSYAKLGEDGVYRADLNAGATAGIAKGRGVDVIPAVRGNQRKGAESVDDLVPVPRTRKPLEQLLKHETGRDHGLSSLESIFQAVDFRRRRDRVPSQREGPHARVDQQGHLRDRPFL